VTRLLLAIAAAIVALVLLYPVSCVGGEFEPVHTCENVMGLALPGFSYRGNDEYTIYLVPLAGMAVAAVATWRLTGRRRPAATSRS
jgi:hypothetical protein